MDTPFICSIRILGNLYKNSFPQFEHIKICCSSILYFFICFTALAFAFGVKGCPPYASFDLNEIQVVSAHFMKNTIAYSPLEFQFIGPYA
jgi:hypothetical protein